MEEIKHGYKQTDIGLIPEDWEVKLLDNLADVIDPHPSHRAPEEATIGIPFLGIGDFNENGDIIKDTYRKVSSSIHDDHLQRYDLNDELLGLGRVASIGKVIKFRNDIGKYTISPTIGVLKPTFAKREFLFHILKSEFTTLYFSKIMSGSTRSSVGMIVLRKIPIPIPKSLSEQIAIATALSDTDALISAMDKKIAKKQKIKQGAMQQLLTGKKRLQGFSKVNKYKETEIGQIPEDWDVKPLDKLANIIDPHPSHRAPVEFTNGIPFLGIGDFNENGDIIKSTYRIVSKSIFTEHNLRYNLNDGLLGLGRVASIGKVIRFRNNIGEFTISPTMGVLKPTLAKRDYLFQILKSE